MQGLPEEEIDPDKLFFDDNKALRDDLLMTEKECLWKRSGASIGAAGNLAAASATQRPGYKSDAHYAQMPKRLRKRTQDHANKNGASTNFALEFDDNYMSNKDAAEGTQDEDNDEGDDSGDQDFFFQEPRTRTLTKVPQLSVEERRKRINLLKHTKAPASRTPGKGPQGNEKVTSSPQAPRRGHLA